VVTALPILDRKLLRDLRHIAGQAAAIVLVVACAVATAVMSFGVLRSLDETRTQYYERYRFADVFASVHRAPESVGEAIRRLPGVAAVQTRLVAEVAIGIEGMEEPLAGRWISLPEWGEPEVNALVLRRGRWISSSDADEVIVGESFANAHGLGPGSRITALLGARKRELTVVGVALAPEYIYALGSGMIAPDDRRFGIFWTGRQVLEAALGARGQFNDVGVRLKESASARDVARGIEALLEPYGAADVHGRERQLSHAFVSAMFHQIAGVGRIVPAIFLLVAAFLVHAVLGRLIETQRQHIGLLKALGIGDRAIGWHYSKLVLILSAIGIAAGLAVGTILGRGLTGLYTEFFHFPFLHYEQDPASVLGAGIVSIAAMGAGALRGVRGASSLMPAMALAPPAPAAYGRTWFDRVAPRGRSSSAARMILRHLGRWPLRAALTAGGLALAVALQISMLFSFDALDHMINGYYARAQAEDFTVLFPRALPNTVADEVARWPGVARVEGFRALPAQLSSGVRARVVNLTGLPATGTLRRLLDAKLAPVPVPPQGLALPGKLAALLEVGVDDTITVQPIGSSTRFNLPVAQIVEQYIGLDAYMSLDALNTLSGSGPAISGAHLLIDPQRRAEFLRGLKDNPLVAGISERSVVLASFRDTMLRTLTIIVSFFVAFAGLTAFGIVLSSARITLSEREREFATLASLGFTAGEVRGILAGEMAILVALALPVGCVLGRALAWVIVLRLDTELYRVPLVISLQTIAIAILVVVAAALVSTWTVARHLQRMDVPAVLNARL
jgi:putative ABC transport system permease protein